MKFFKYKPVSIKFIIKLKFIIDNKLTAIISDPYNISFYQNGLKHNDKNAANIKDRVSKTFCLDGKLYGYENDFTKESWRKFTKLKVFL